MRPNLERLKALIIKKKRGATTLKIKTSTKAQGLTFLLQTGSSTAEKAVFLRCFCANKSKYI